MSLTATWRVADDSCSVSGLCVWTGLLESQIGRLVELADLRHANAFDAEDELNSSWPPFLDHLPDEPERAFQGFANWAFRLFQVIHISDYFSIVQSIHAHDPGELVTDLILSFRKRDFHRLRSYEDRGKSFRSYVLLIAGRDFVSVWRKQQRREAADLDELRPDQIPGTDPDPSDLESKDRERLRGMFGDLGKECCLLMTLRYVDGLSNKDIAASFPQRYRDNKDVGTRIHRCHEKFRKLLGSWKFHPEDFGLEGKA